MLTLKNNTVENDDWIKTLPGYQDEAEIHDMLAKKKKEHDEDPDRVRIDAARKAAGLGG